MRPRRQLKSVYPDFRMFSGQVGNCRVGWPWPLESNGNGAGRLDNRCHRVFIPRIVFRARRGHDTPACGKSASGRKILRSRGRPTSRPVERREAQRPFSGLRKPVGRLAPRLASGRRNPVRQARSRSLVSSGKGSRKPLAPPGAPFSFRTETGNGRPRARPSAGAAERWLKPIMSSVTLV
jgi:hypothetical protein